MSKLFSKKRTSLAAIMLFCISSFGLVFFVYQNTSTTAFASEFEQSQTSTLNYYIESDNSINITDGIDSFLSNTANDAKIEVFFELQFDTVFQDNLRNTVNDFSTKAEIDRA